MKKILLAILLCVSILFAQHSISGVVQSSKTGKTIPYVNVFLPEQGKGCMTDEDGHFKLSDIPQGKIKIEFSYIGFASQVFSLQLTEDKANLNVKLKPVVLKSPEIIVSGGSYSSQHENAINIETLKPNEIAQSGTPSFTEAISSIAGVDMIAKGSGVGKPVIRGLSMTNILMLNNGVKLENFQFSENHPFLIDEFGIDHIEIIKGPASLLYGSDAVGGVINVVKEKPAPVGKIVGDYNLQTHSNTMGLVSNLGLKGSGESIYWTLRGGIKSHKDYIDGTNNYIPNTRFNTASFKASTGLHNSFGLFRIYYDYNRDKLGMSVPDVLSLIAENDRINEFWYQDLSNHVISTRNTLFLNNYKVDINAAYQMNNRRLQTSNSTPAFELVDMDLNTLSYELKTHLPSSLASEYTVGIQGTYKTNRNHEAPNHVLPDANVSDISAFALMRYGNEEKFHLQTGLRYDHRDVYAETATVIDTNYGNVSASLGATYQLSSSLLLRGNIATAYRTPNLAEMTQNGMHGNRYEIGNIDLKSQRSYETDINAHFHSGWLMVDASAYYHLINNYIYMAPTADTTTGGIDIYQYEQTDASIFGTEFNLAITPWEWLIAEFAYTYTLGQQTDGMYLPFIPQNKLKFDIGLQRSDILFFNKVYVNIGGTYAARQDKPARFETETNPYFVVNAKVGGDIIIKGQPITVSIQANNILNEYYIDHLSTLKGLGYGNLGRNFSFSLILPFTIK